MIYYKCIISNPFMSMGVLFFIFLCVNHRNAGESLHFLSIYDIIYAGKMIMLTFGFLTIISFQRKRGRIYKEQVVATYLFFALKYGIVYISSRKRVNCTALGYLLEGVTSYPV